MIDRYALPVYSEIWSDKNKYNKWLFVELAYIEALLKNGVIKEEDHKVILEKARPFFDTDIQKIKGIESITKHDVFAFLIYLEELIGPSSRWIHHGLTSSDVVDTAFSLVLREATAEILESIDKLKQVLSKKATTYKLTPIMGRTHGMHAEPTTLGLIFLGWLSEICRHEKWIKNALEDCSYGKFSGSVGNFAHSTPEIEKDACLVLGLKFEPVSTQVIPRDRYSNLFLSLANYAASLEKIALNIRHYSRTEVSELFEPSSQGQRGSSSMPHKKNPIICENICGLARVIRFNAFSSVENVPLWHERDISHSSVERIISPEITSLVGYTTEKITQVLQYLVIDSHNAGANMAGDGGVYFSQSIMLLLVENGVAREKAHKLVQDAITEANHDNKTFIEYIFTKQEILDLVGTFNLESLLNVELFHKNTEKIFNRFYLQNI